MITQSSMKKIVVSQPTQTKTMKIVTKYSKNRIIIEIIRHRKLALQLRELQPFSVNGNSQVLCYDF